MQAPNCVQGKGTHGLAVLQGGLPAQALRRWWQQRSVHNAPLPNTPTVKHAAAIFAWN